MSPIQNVADFNAQISRFAQRLPEDHLVPWQKKIALDLYAGVVQDTPVDQGRAAGGWVISIGGEPPAEPTERLDPEKIIGREAALATLATLRPFEVIWISNSIPYILVLELGLYPDPVHLGTWVPGAGGTPGHYEKRSEHGYSKRSPGGMLLVNLQRIASVYPD